MPATFRATWLRGVWRQLLFSSLFQSCILQWPVCQFGILSFSCLAVGNLGKVTLNWTPGVDPIPLKGVCSGLGSPQDSLKNHKNSSLLPIPSKLTKSVPKVSKTLKNDTQTPAAADCDAAPPNQQWFLR